jgi:Lrp/AsnC family leucine-responsive transcriptional regulator
VLHRQEGRAPHRRHRNQSRLLPAERQAVRALVDPAKVGARVEAFVLVALAEHSEGSDARFADALAEIPAVLRADAVTGPDDVLLHVAAADARELQNVLRTLPRVGARRVTTLLRLEAVKAPSPIPTRDT